MWQFSSKLGPLLGVLLGALLGCSGAVAWCNSGTAAGCDSGAVSVCVAWMVAGCITRIFLAVLSECCDLGLGSKG